MHKWAVPPLPKYSLRTYNCTPLETAQTSTTLLYLQRAFSRRTTSRSPGGSPRRSSLVTARGCGRGNFSCAPPPISLSRGSCVNSAQRSISRGLFYKIPPAGLCVTSDLIEIFLADFVFCVGVPRPSSWRVRCRCFHSVVLVERLLSFWCQCFAINFGDS